jgi:hypothetical protein
VPPAGIELTITDLSFSSTQKGKKKKAHSHNVPPAGLEPTITDLGFSSTQKEKEKRQTSDSCLLHSVIAEVQRIQKTTTLAFTQQSETLRTEIARHMHQHQNLWLDNAPPSTTNLKAIPSTPLQQLHDRITSCATSGTYLGTDQLHIMATMLHPHGIRIVNYRFDRLCFDQLTLIHHLDYTNPHTNNALQTSLLTPQDIRPNDIVICNTQPGRHWFRV